MASKGKRDPNFPMQGRRGGMGGRYGSKSTNLTAKQLKAAGAAKAAAKNKVSVSETRREGSRTLGPKGKPLTGTVTLADGSKAVYRNGRRVQAADARKPRTQRPSSGPRDKGGDKPNNPPPKRKDTVATAASRDRALAGRRGTASQRDTGSGDAAKARSRSQAAAGARYAAQAGPRRSSLASVRYSNGRVNTDNGARASRLNSGWVRGTAGKTQAELRAKRAEDDRNQLRNALAVAGLVSVPVALGAGPAAGAGAAAARAAGAAAARGAAGAAARGGAAAARGTSAARGAVARGADAAGKRLGLGGRSASGKSTSNKVVVALARQDAAVRKAEAARKAAAARAARAGN